MDEQSAFHLPPSSLFLEYKTHTDNIHTNYSLFSLRLFELTRLAPSNEGASYYILPKEKRREREKSSKALILDST